MESGRVSGDNSQGLVSKEDIQSASPSLQDSEKVCGSKLVSQTNAYSCFFIFFYFLPFSFCFVFFSGKTVEQNQGSAVKTWMHRRGSQIMWVRLPGQQFHGSPNMNSLGRSWINEYSGNKNYGLLCHFEDKYLVWTSNDHFNHLWHVYLCYCVSTLLY